MSTKKRHRLRLLNKKLCYSIGFFRELFPDERVAPQEAALKYLRKAQRSLGRLNDDANSQALAVALQRDGVKVPPEILNPKREKRLLRTAAAAYQKAMFEQSQPAAMFYVDDVQREHDRMKPLGAEFTMPPTKVTGSTIAMLKDTCGNLIQIVTLDRWQS